MSMSFRLLAVSVVFAFAGAAFASPQSSMAAPTAKTPTAQQQRMSVCNKEATGKKGDLHKTFMSSCLKGETAAAPAPNAAKTTQQQKMTNCNATAKTKALSGDVRKTFMSTCLKNAPASP